METVSRFEFAKKRSISEVINASFRFIRLEFLHIAKPILFIVGPLLLLSSILSTQYQTDIFSNLDQFKGNPFEMYDIGSMLLLNILALFVMIMLNIIIYEYIRLYIEDDESRFHTVTLFNLTIKKIVPFFLYNLLYVILLLVAWMLLILPGIYFSISLSLVFAVMIQENLGFMDALRRSSALVKNHWWFTLGVIFLSLIIIYVLQIIVALPATIMGVIIGLNGLEPDLVEGVDLGLWMGIVSALNQLSYLIYGMYLVVIGVHYFNLRERKNASGLLDRIDSLDAQL